MKKLRFPAALIAAAAILLRPEAAAAGAQQAMRVWFASVAPSLFPFLVLMPLLTGPEACAVYDFLFGRFMRPVFHLNGSAASAMIVSMLAGSPCGTMAARRIAAQGSLTGSEAKRLALAVCGVSPAFLIFGVGISTFHSAAFGLRLAAAQFVAQLLLLFALRGAEFDNIYIEMPQAADASPVRQAVETIVCICGYMTFFSAMARVASGFLNDTAGKVMLMIADLPSGLHALAETRIRGRLFLAGAVTGFGGLCIGMQNLDAGRQLGIQSKTYFAARAAAAAITACLCVRAGEGHSAHLSEAGVNLPVLSISAVFLLSVPVLIYLSNQQSVNNSKLT